MGILTAPMDTEVASSKAAISTKALAVDEDDDEDEELADAEETRRVPKEDTSSKVADILTGAMMFLLVILLIKLLGPALARSILGKLLSLGSGSIKQAQKAVSEQ
jgi:hypothetical protein